MCLCAKHKTQNASYTEARAVQVVAAYENK